MPSQYMNLVDVDAILNDIKSLPSMSKPEFKKARKQIIDKHAHSIIEQLRNKIHPSLLELTSRAVYKSLGTYLPVEMHKKFINGNIY